MSKKEQERPRFRCDKCGCIWVYHEPMCIVCGTLGTALNKKKKIKRLKRENADLRERLKYIEGYFTASNVVIKAFEDSKSAAESLTNALKKGAEIND